MAAGQVKSRAANDPIYATRRASALLSTADVEPMHGGPIGKHRKQVGSEPQSYRAVRDSVHREQWR